jgi:phage FluMu protein Com
MPIEFRCSHCGKLLRTGDGTAGHQAQCPECATICTIPGASAPSGPTGPTGSPGSITAPPSGGSPFGAIPQQPQAFGGAENPYQSPYSTGALPGQIDPTAAQRVVAPAIAMIVTAILGMIIVVAFLCFMFLGLAIEVKRNHAHQETAMLMVGVGFWVVMGLISVVLGIIVCIGAGKMKRLENYNWAMTAAIISVIPCVTPCGILSLPFSIWALVVLCDDNVKAAFQWKKQSKGY